MTKVLFSARQSQFPHFPGHILVSKPDPQHVWLRRQFLTANSPLIFGVLASEAQPQPFWVFTVVPFVWLFDLFIFKCQWSSLALGTRNSGHSAAVLHIAGAGRWELHLPGSFAIKIVLYRLIDSTHEQATQDLRSGRKHENIASLAPARCKILQQLPGVPPNAVIFSRSSLQFLRLPGSPNFSGKPEHKWQCSLTLVPLAFQQFWKHLNEISYFLRDVRMLPSDPQIVKANIDQTPPRCEHSVKLFTCSMPQDEIAMRLLLSLFLLCPGSQRKQGAELRLTPTLTLKSGHIWMLYWSFYPSSPCTGASLWAHKMRMMHGSLWRHVTWSKGPGRPGIRLHPWLVSLAPPSCPWDPATGLLTKCSPQCVSVGLSVEACISKNLRILEFGRFLAHF